jgi:ATP-dependent DNA ligase
VSTLLLGLYERDELRHVGVVGSFPATRRLELVDELRPLVTSIGGHPWEQGFALEGGARGRLPGSAGRWAPGMTLDWVPLRPVLVCEASHGPVDGVRWRHPGRFLRWRPDRDPARWTVEQLR